MQPAHAAQAPGKKHHAVLQIALTPAAVAPRVFDDSLRALLVTALQVVGKPNPPVFPRQQRRFDKIVAENLAAVRAASGQLRQIAKLHERFGADEGVVSPVISKIERPIIQSGDEHGRVKPVGELLDAAEERFGVHQRRHRLNQPDARMRLHQFHQVHSRLSAHDAVGVANHEVAVTAAPGIEEVAHVAALAALVVQAAAVVNAAERIEFADQVIPAPLLLDPFVRVRRVAEDEEIKPFEFAGFVERFIGGAQPFINADGVFVADGEDDRGAGAGEALRAIIRQLRDALPGAKCPQHEPIDSVHAADGGEQKQNHEQNQQHRAGGGPARAPEQIRKQHGDQPRQQDGG